MSKRKPLGGEKKLLRRFSAEKPWRASACLPNGSGPFARGKTIPDGCLETDLNYMDCL